MLINALALASALKVECEYSHPHAASKAAPPLDALGECVGLANALALSDAPAVSVRSALAENDTDAVLDGECVDVRLGEAECERESDAQPVDENVELFEARLVDECVAVTHAEADTEAYALTDALTEAAGLTDKGTLTLTHNADALCVMVESALIENVSVVTIVDATTGAPLTAIGAYQ